MKLLCAIILLVLCFFSWVYFGKEIIASIYLGDLESMSGAFSFECPKFLPNPELVLIAPGKRLDLTSIANRGYRVFPRPENAVPNSRIPPSPYEHALIYVLSFNGNVRESRRISFRDVLVYHSQDDTVISFPLAKIEKMGPETSCSLVISVDSVLLDLCSRYQVHFRYRTNQRNRM